MRSHTKNNSFSGRRTRWELMTSPRPVHVLRCIVPTDAGVQFVWRRSQSGSPLRIAGTSTVRLDNRLQGRENALQEQQVSKDLTLGVPRENRNEARWGDPERNGVANSARGLHSVGGFAFRIRIIPQRFARHTMYRGAVYIS
jgi:hypothetical protein